MASNQLFYFPYASLGTRQSPLLRAAALYFDSLFLLDPLKASWGSVGPGSAEGDVRLLEQEGILKRIAPEEVMHRYEDAIAASIRADMQDPEFVRLCEEFGEGRHWTLALAKVPRAIRADPEFHPIDQSMRAILGDTARGFVAEAEGEYRETSLAYAETLEVFDEYREVDDGAVEYRYADYPLALGESIMLNHAIFAGLAHSAATPITDDPFHSRVLRHKIERAQRIPEVRRILEDEARDWTLRADTLAAAALTNLKLGILPAEVPLERVLEYRAKHAQELEHARTRLAWLAQEVRGKPLSDGFADHLKHVTIPAIRKELHATRSSLRSWLKGAGIAVAGATTVASLVVSATPLMPFAVVTGVLALVSGVAIPGADLALDRREKKGDEVVAGLHYFLKLRA
jgi:hypothetical protein